MAFAMPLLRGCRIHQRQADFEALLVESDLESVGSFACSNELLNRIYVLISGPSVVSIWADTWSIVRTASVSVMAMARSPPNPIDESSDAQFLHEMVGRLASRSGSEDG